MNARARDGEPIVYTYYFDWPFDSYYNRRNLPYYNAVIERHQEISEEVAQQRAAEVVATGAPSLWLMLFPGPENTDRVERAFNALAFPGERVWFPGGRGVVHYYTGRPLVSQPGGARWGDLIGLAGWAAAGVVDSAPGSPAPTVEVAAGDALRLEFQWQRLGKIPEHYLRTLNLVGPDGAVWSKLGSEPCNGRCATSDWKDAPVTDRLAFQVQPDVPPGEYKLQLNWFTDKGASLTARAGDSVLESGLDLATVRVTAPLSPVPATPPLAKTLNASVRPGLTLRSSGFGDAPVRAGATLAVPLQWEVNEPQPALDLQLFIQGRSQAALVQPLGPAWHPTADWQPGRVIATRTGFTLPSDLPPGDYRVSVGVAEAGASPASAAVVPLGRLVVEDRPHSFTLPAGGEPVDLACDEGVRLVRAGLPESVLPGSTVPITLTWQAGGPTKRNWKVFIHVFDAAGERRTQSDGYPLDGGAFTSSWQPQEVLVDVHDIPLPADLPPGEYTVRLGFYDEPTGERLACAGSDVLTLPRPLVVHAR